MDLIIGICNLSIGLIMSLLGFKFYNPFKGKNEPEKEELWFKKFGAFFKIGGIIMLILGVLKTVSNIN
ncbi:MAG: hypothetical protein RLZZ175_1902 [Bacteroidota bacterium]|jgi:hypothetical protein